MLSAVPGVLPQRGTESSDLLRHLLHRGVPLGRPHGVVEHLEVVRVVERVDLH